VTTSPDDKFNPRKLLAVFEKGGSCTFAIDAVQVVVRPIELGPDLHIPFRYNNDALASLKAKMKRDKGEFIASFRLGEVPVRLALTQHNIAATFGPTSMLRRVRYDLIRDGLYPGGRRSEEARNDNYVDQTLLRGPVDLHTASIAKVRTFLEESRGAYIDLCRRVFGAAPAAVAKSIAQIELTWDRPTSIAKAAPTLCLPAWRDSWPGAAWMDKAPEYRETHAVRGAGVLRADDIKGQGKKLYPKTTALLRFEAELTRDRMTTLLKRPLSLESHGLLQADLESLAEEPYQGLLRAQRLLTTDTVLDVPELFEVFASAGKWSKVKPIFRAFWSGAEFHNVGEHWGKELTRLRKRDAAEYIGKGVWGPGLLVARFFHLAQFFARHAG
jgi:hypothetical protein